ncbi:MAG: hypothetical protein WAX44_03315 [Minisyncoccia bacterium]
MGALIENSFALTTHLLKKDLRKTRKKESVEGYLNIVHNNKPSVADYYIEHEDEKAYLVVTFALESQRFELSEQELTFGTRSYLTCGCGSRTNALYLSNGVFACRKCHRLQYASTRINRHSKHGQFLYKQSRIIKLMAIRESMNRIFYKGQYSKRFMHWLGQYAQLGLIQELEEAEKLKKAMNS